MKAAPAPCSRHLPNSPLTQCLSKTSDTSQQGQRHRQYPCSEALPLAHREGPSRSPTNGYQSRKLKRSHMTEDIASERFRISQVLLLNPSPQTCQWGMTQKGEPALGMSPAAWRTYSGEALDSSPGSKSSSYFLLGALSPQGSGQEPFCRSRRQR